MVQLYAVNKLFPRTGQPCAIHHKKAQAQPLASIERKRHLEGVTIHMASASTSSGCAYSRSADAVEPREVAQVLCCGGLAGYLRD